MRRAYARCVHRLRAKKDKVGPRRRLREEGASMDNKENSASFRGGERDAPHKEGTPAVQAEEGMKNSGTSGNGASKTPVPGSVSSVRLPKRGSLLDGSGSRIGKIRKSIWYDGSGKEEGVFRKENESVYFYAGNERKGYVDRNNNVFYTEGDTYVATIRRFSWLPILLIIILLLIATLLSVVLGAYYFRRSDDYAPVLFIADEDGTEWSEERNLPVFENERFGDSVIAPGMSGTYRFMLRNENEDSLDFSLLFSETNAYEIGLCYKLKRDGVYLAGAEDAYVSVSELGRSDMTIEPESASLFELEWYWAHNDPIDTTAGENDADYTLYIRFDASVIL